MQESEIKTELRIRILLGKDRSLSSVEEFIGEPITKQEYASFVGELLVVLESIKQDFIKEFGGIKWKKLE